MTRTLVLGDPIVHLGDGDWIPDGALVVEDGVVAEVGPRERFEGGTFDDVIGGPGHFVMPGFVNCHFHSEAALGHGVYDLIFERANIWMHSTFVRMREEDLHVAVLNLLISAIRGGQTGVVDMYYGNPNLDGTAPASRCARTRRSGCASPSGSSRATRTGTSTNPTMSSAAACRGASPTNSRARPSATPGRSRKSTPHTGDASRMGRSRRPHPHDPRP